MGEIDTKPIESVQNALSLFGQKGDNQRKNRPTCSSDDEKERELENVLKDLAHYKVQLEAKDAAYMQALLKLEHSKKLVEELSTLLKNNEIQKEHYADECEKIHKQFSCALVDLQAKEAELASLRKSETKALAQAELFERDFEVERDKREELEKQVSERDANIALAKTDLLAAQERLEKTRREVEMALELENQLLSKMILVDMLFLQIEEVNEELKSSQKSASDATAYSKLLQEELEIKNRKISSQVALIEAFKLEARERKLELQDLNKKENDEADMFKISQFDAKTAEALIFVPKTEYEVENLKRELETATGRVAEFRNRAEQATYRAEMAEKAKSAIEDQLRKWREDRRRKRAELRLQPEPEKINENQPKQPTYYVPLYKVINMKF